MRVVVKELKMLQLKSMIELSKIFSDYWCLLDFVNDDEKDIDWITKKIWG